MGGEEKNGCEVQSFLPHADLPGLLHGYLRAWPQPCNYLLDGSKFDKLTDSSR